MRSIKEECLSRLIFFGKLSPRRAVVVNGFFRWRRYPALLNRPPQPAPSDASPPTHEAILAAVRSIHSSPSTRRI